ncbi:MAG: hypothetical protein QG650_40 [Patescibacteria group bacterium]|nr:hypothetical protein [Patescibacteria group bacterium]
MFLENVAAVAIVLVLGYFVLALAFTKIPTLRHWQVFAVRRWALACIRLYQETKDDPFETVRDIRDCELCARDVLAFAEEILGMDEVKPNVASFIFWPSDLAIAVGLEWKAMEIDGVRKKKSEGRLRRAKSRA